MEESDDMINVKNLCKKYNSRTIIEDFNYSFEDNSLNIIIGKSGSGKTTLLNIIGMLDNKYDGEISIDGNNYKNIKKSDYFRNSFGFVFQNYALIDNYTIYDNLSIPLNIKKLSKVQREKSISEVLEKVGLNISQKQKVYELSGGEKQRIALARVILKNPDYIFADEPTGNLDADNALIIKQLLYDLNKNGKTLFIATHADIFKENYDNLINMNKITNTDR